MPVIYQAQCSNCDHLESLPDGVLAVIRAPGQSVSESTSCSADYPELIYLPHPGEEHVLSGLGLTLISAMREKRIVLIRYAICKDCGRTLELPTLRSFFPVWNCVLLPAFVIIGVFVGFLTQLPADFAVLLGIGIAIALTAALSWGTHGYMRWKLPDLTARYTGRQPCPECCSHRCFRPSAMSRTRLPCPKCKAKTLRIFCTGRS